MRKRLEIRKERLSDLTVDELAGVGGAAVKTTDVAAAILRMIVGPGDWTTNECLLTYQNCG